jgi:hypothetical protein
MAKQVERRLTTILAADVAEYSRLLPAPQDGCTRMRLWLAAVLGAADG